MTKLSLVELRAKTAETIARVRIHFEWIEQDADSVVSKEFTERLCSIKEAIDALATSFTAEELDAAENRVIGINDDDED
jgi:hypothetical protein